VGKAIKFQETP